MKRKLIFLNLLLAGLTVAAGWKLREQYLADQQHTDTLRRQQIKPKPAPVLAPIPKPDAFTPAAYVDVAQKNLFSKDRNPNVVVEVPPPPPVKKMPALPVVMGIMGLPSGVTAMMSDKPGGAVRGVRVGETVGAFKVLALSRQDVSLEWDGQRIDKKVDDLLERVAATPEAAATPANAAEAAAAPNAPPAPAKPSTITIGDDMKACVPGDPSPGGTVVDGYRKVKEATPFGEACRWYKVK